MRDQTIRAFASGSWVRHLSAAPVALLLALATGCLGIPNPLQRVDAPSFLLLDVRPIQGGNLEQRLELELLAQNPNNFDVVLDGVRLDLEMNGQRIAKSVSNQSVSIGRLGETRVTVQASVTLRDATRSFLTLARREADGSLTYKVSGDAFIVQPRSTRVSFENNGDVLPATSARAR